MPNNIRAHVFIKGWVQRVFFRKNTRMVATQHNVKGWVKNLEDRRVEAILEGDETNVSKVLEWLHIGPPGAQVEKVEVEYKTFTGEFNNFTIIQ